MPAVISLLRAVNVGGHNRIKMDAVRDVGVPSHDRIQAVPCAEFCLVDYQTYLRTPKWRRKREQRLKLDSYACQKCGNTSKEYRLEVHHLTYERLGRERMEDLKTLCFLCHPIETSEQRRTRYAKRAIVLPDAKRKTPIITRKEDDLGLQDLKLKDYRRRTPPHA